MHKCCTCNRSYWTSFIVAKLHKLGDNFFGWKFLQVKQRTAKDLVAYYF